MKLHTAVPLLRTQPEFLPVLGPANSAGLAFGNRRAPESSPQNLTPAPLPLSEIFPPSQIPIPHPDFPSSPARNPAVGNRSWPVSETRFSLNSPIGFFSSPQASINIPLPSYLYKTMAADRCGRTTPPSIGFQASSSTRRYFLTLPDSAFTLTHRVVSS